MYSQMPPQMYAMPTEAYPYGGFVPPPYMGHTMYAYHGPNFGAPPPHMQGMQPPPFFPTAADSASYAPKQSGATTTASRRSQSPKNVSDVQNNLAFMQDNEAKPVDTQPAMRDAPSATTSASVPFSAPKPEDVPSASEGPDSLVTETQAKKPEISEPSAVSASKDVKPNPAAETGEFDFEKANARFSKKPTTLQGPDQTSGKLSAIPPAEAQTFYDKKSGFFDNISSEVKDRLEGGRNRHAIAEEKERNMLTFGDEAANFNGPPRRSRGRGHRSHGRRAGGRNHGPSKPEWV